MLHITEDHRLNIITMENKGILTFKGVSLSIMKMRENESSLKSHEPIKYNKTRE